MKTAFLFPGQGAQIVGMGADVSEHYSAAAEIYRRADEVLGYKLSSICFKGPAETLNTTVVSQPAIFVTSAAILQVIRTEAAEGKITPAVTAGLSLGEYTALYAAGVMTFEDALVLVQQRGKAMQEAADTTEGAMLSIIGLDEEAAAQLCEQAGQGQILSAVNFNCPGQIVISGAREACERAERLAPEYGAIKVVRLGVAGAFHTEMMSLAADKLSRALADCPLCDPADIRVIANVDAEYYRCAEDVRKGLTMQLTSPVLWQQSIERLLKDEVEEFYEIGPGRVLTGLMKRISRKTRIVNVSTLDGLGELTRCSV